MVIWITGMSGSGKTTVARELVAQLRQRGDDFLHLDGDDIREAFGLDETPSAHTIEGRRVNAERILGICKWLDNIHRDVVVSVLSVFPDLLIQNRCEFSRYLEVFLDVPMHELERRDSKHIYSRYAAGQLRNVVGLDIPYPRPVAPDLTIAPEESEYSPVEIARRIQRHM
jgi:adenylylsulfate kinase